MDSVVHVGHETDMPRRPDPVAPRQSDLEEFQDALGRQPIVVLETTGFLKRPDGRFDRLPLDRRCALLTKEPDRIVSAWMSDPKTGKRTIDPILLRYALHHGLIQIRPRLGDLKPRAYTPVFIESIPNQFLTPD